jgi:hypothetical protein
MSISNDVKRALSTQQKWASSGSKASVKYNRQNGTNFLHDVSVLSMFITSADPRVQELLLSTDGVSVLREDVSTIPRKTQYTSFSSFYTYILTLTERKFGKNSVRKDINDDPHGFRGFDSKPEVIEFAQSLAKITLERIKIRNM